MLSVSIATVLLYSQFGCLLFSCLIALIRTFSTMLNNSESGHLCLVLISEESFQFFTILYEIKGSQYSLYYSTTSFEVLLLVLAPSRHHKSKWSIQIRPRSPALTLRPVLNKRLHGGQVLRGETQKRATQLRLRTEFRNSLLEEVIF